MPKMISLLCLILFWRAIREKLAIVLLQRPIETMGRNSGHAKEVHLLGGLDVLLQVKQADLLYTQHFPGGTIEAHHKLPVCDVCPDIMPDAFCSQVRGDVGHGLVVLDVRHNLVVKHACSRWDSRELDLYGARCKAAEETFDADVTHCSYG